MGIFGPRLALLPPKMVIISNKVRVDRHNIRIIGVLTVKFGLRKKYCKLNYTGVQIIKKKIKFVLRIVEELDHSRLYTYNMTILY